MRRGILAGRDELRSLSDRIGRKPFTTIYDVLRKRCSLILESAPIRQTQWRSLWEQGRAGAAVQAARTTQGRMLDLLIAHHIDANPAYRDRAIEELQNLLSWGSWVDPSHHPLSVDLCTAEAAVAAVVAADWLWEDLDETQRQAVLKGVKERVIAPYLEGVRDKAWWYDCYHNWNAVVNSGCGLAALALSDEDPQAQEAYELSRTGLKHFFGALGREGGWDEGTGHWGYAMRYVLLFAEATTRILDDEQIFHRRGMDKTGLFPVYFTPNGRAAGFAAPAVVPLYGTFYLLAKRYGLKEVTWWLDTYAFHRDVSISGWSSAGLALLFRPVKQATPQKPKLKCVKVFTEVGWAAMADTWPKPTMYAAAKAGDLAAHHARRDMNSVHLQVDGEMLLANVVRSGNDENHYAGPGTDMDQVQAVMHNTIIVAERDHQIDARGAIREAQNGKGFRWICCDAAAACGENVRFIRHLLMVVDTASGTGEALIVLDELTNGVPERVDLFWHSAGNIEMDSETLCGTIRGQEAEVYFALCSTVKSRCWTESRRVDAQTTDNFVHLTAGVMDKALFASVFSRTPLKGAPTIETDPDGDVRIMVGERTVRFTAGREYLKLQKIAST